MDVALLLHKLCTVITDFGTSQMVRGVAKDILTELESVGIGVVKQELAKLESEPEPAAPAVETTQADAPAPVEEAPAVEAPAPVYTAPDESARLDAIEGTLTAVTASLQAIADRLSPPEVARDAAPSGGSDTLPA